MFRAIFLLPWALSLCPFSEHHRDWRGFAGKNRTDILSPHSTWNTVTLCTFTRPFSSPCLFPRCLVTSFPALTFLLSSFSSLFIWLYFQLLPLRPSLLSHGLWVHCLKCCPTGTEFLLHCPQRPTFTMSMMLSWSTCDSGGSVGTRHSKYSTFFPTHTCLFCFVVCLFMVWVFESYPFFY